MPKHQPNFCFLPIPRVFWPFIKQIENPIPFWLSETLGTADSEQLTFSALADFTPSQELLARFDANTLSAINDLCLNILEITRLKNSHTTLGEDLIGLLKIPLNELPFKGPVLLKSLSKHEIFDSLGLANMTFRDFFNLHSGGIKNAYLSSLILERYCNEAVNSDENNKDNKKEILKHVSKLGNKESFNYRVRRYWIENADFLNKSGFTSGKRYTREFISSTSTLRLTLDIHGHYNVSRGRPIIDITTAEISDIWGEEVERVITTCKEKGVLEIRPINAEMRNSSAVYDEEPKEIDLDEIIDNLLNKEFIQLVSLSDTRFRKQKFSLNQFIDNKDSALLIDVLEYLLDSQPEKLGDRLKIREALNNLEKEIETIQQSSLKNQLLEPFLFNEQEYRKRRNLFISDRFGLRGNDPLTLQKVGDNLNVSRERIRQIESKFKEKLNGKQFFIPKLDEILSDLTELIPISDSDFKTYLESKKFGSYSAKSLKAISELYERDFPFQLKTSKGQLFITSSEDQGFRKIMITAKKFSSSTGFVNTSDLRDYLYYKYDYEIEPDQISSTLHQGPFIKLTDDWFISNEVKEGRNRFKNIVFKMIYCVNPIQIKDIREGVKREFFQRKHLQKEWPWLLAPTNVMKKYLEITEGFIVDEEVGVTASKEILDSYVPAEHLEKIKLIIQAQPNQIIDNRAFLESCKAAGVKESSLMQYFSYAPYLERFDQGIWGLRGSRPKVEDIANLRDYVKYLPRKKRKLGEGFNEKGQIEVIVKIGQVINHNLYITGKCADMLGNQPYNMIGTGGTELGKMFKTPSKETILSGSSKALIRLGVESEDLVRYTFDISKNEVLIEPIPESAIWDV